MARPYGNFLIILLSIVAILSGCGRKSDSNLSGNSSSDARPQSSRAPSEDVLPVGRVSTEHLSNSIELIRRAQAFCDRNQNCPEGVAVVGVALERSAHQCTGFLVGSNLVMTSAHCLPNNLDGVSCRSRISVVFPSIVRNQHRVRGIRVGCEEIVKRTIPSDPLRSLDFALIKTTAPVDRTPLRVNHDGVGDGQELKVWRAQFGNSTGIVGRISSTTCSVQRETVLSYGSDSSHNPIEVLVDCPIQEGNSGSPVLNSQGEVVGIIRQSVRHGAAPSYPLWIRRASRAPNHFRAMARMNSLSCMPVIGLDEIALPSTCGGPLVSNYGEESLQRAFVRDSVSWRNHLLRAGTAPANELELANEFIGFSAFRSREGADAPDLRQQSRLGTVSDIEFNDTGVMLSHMRILLAPACTAELTSGVAFQLEAQLRVNEKLQPHYEFRVLDRGPYRWIGEIQSCASH